MTTPKFYTPPEAAKKLGIKPRMLQYYRLNERIKGRRVGSTTLYSEEQLREGAAAIGVTLKSDEEAGIAADESEDELRLATATR